MEIALCAAQQQTFGRLTAALSDGHVFVVSGGSGYGRTTILRALHRRVGGAFLTMKEFLDALRPQHPLRLEETFEALVLDALKTNDHVIVDDLHRLTDVAAGYCGAYPRPRLLEAPLTTLTSYAQEVGKKLVIGTAHGAPEPVLQRALQFGIPDYTPDDYAFLGRAHLGSPLADGLDYAKIHRFATSLNAHLFRTVCPALRRRASLSTQEFIDYLREHGLASNVDLGEVQRVELRDLKGIDEIIESLEANVILPFENDELSAELGLKPKRGVLLLGPPGTGKTTVGRALAHRLKGKFFLIDGTFIAGTSDFYWQVRNVFEAAKHNAPSVLFVDDSDAIFESGTELGLYRYLLTMLDGLESASAGRVCVMMTAMEIGHLPPALLRSGRIELWLEMKLPDHGARAAILSAHLVALPKALGEVDFERLVALSAGFTGADLKRLAEDGKLLLAHDRVRSLPLRPLTDYFAEAAATVRSGKERYAAAEALARQQRPLRGPPQYDHVGQRGNAEED